MSDDLDDLDGCGVDFGETFADPDEPAHPVADFELDYEVLFAGVPASELEPKAAEWQAVFSAP